MKVCELLWGVGEGKRECVRERDVGGWIDEKRRYCGEREKRV